MQSTDAVGPDEVFIHAPKPIKSIADTMQVFLEFGKVNAVKESNWINAIWNEFNPQY